MAIEAIIFDKDGTLMDFDAFWLNVTIKALTDVLSYTLLPDIPLNDILEPFGVHNGITSIEGVVCKGTYAQMGEIVYNILKSHGYEGTLPDTVKLVEDMYVKNADVGEILPTCENLLQTLQTLKERGLKLAVVTTDNREMTVKCLDTLGVTQYFDAIYTDDGTFPTKPSPASGDAFCKRFGLKKESVLMVGDTMTDVEFSQNAGFSMIGVAKTEENKQLLLQHIKTVVPDVSYLPAVLLETATI